MLQQIIALIIFIIAVAYALYNFILLFIPSKGTNSLRGCQNCGGACHISELKAIKPK